MERDWKWITALEMRERNREKWKKKESAETVTQATASRSRQSEVMRVRDERRGKKEENTEQSLSVCERESECQRESPLPSLAQ